MVHGLWLILSGCIVAGFWFMDERLGVRAGCGLRDGTCKGLERLDVPAPRRRCPCLGSRFTSVEQTWHIQDSQGQILALAFRSKSFMTFKDVPSSLGSGLGVPAPHRRQVCLVEG